MTQRLYALTADIPAISYDAAPQVNSLFPRLPPESIEPLREWCFFWDWDVAAHQVRWMTSWDTTIDDVERFAAGVRHVLTP
jgi:threonine aldolase